jgi:hypothetical protein
MTQIAPPLPNTHTHNLGGLVGCVCWGGGGIVYTKHHTICDCGCKATTHHSHGPTCNTTCPFRHNSAPPPFLTPDPSES